MGFDKLREHLRRVRRSSSPPTPTSEVTIDGYPSFPPPTPEELLSYRSHFEELLSQRQHLFPWPAKDDTPLFALYRVYEHLVLNQTTGLRNEFERFWCNGWPVSSIPDPVDITEPERYAVLACVPALMVEAFNKRIEMGIPREVEAIILGKEIEAYSKQERQYETVPEWTLKVEPLKEVLTIPLNTGEVLESMDDERASPQLREKNILCWQPHNPFCVEGDRSSLICP
jgi:hypothetical protein